MSRWRWSRLCALVCGSMGGLVGTYAIMASDTVPRAVIALVGILLIVGVGCSAALLLLAYVIVTEDIRPRFVGRRPVMPLSLNTELSALIGQRRFQTHPVRFWTGVILNHQVFFGLLVFSKPESLTFTSESSHD